MLKRFDKEVAVIYDENKDKKNPPLLIKKIKRFLELEKMSFEEED